ncbi:MAG: TauD/TfdA family dioxygenase, partial [Cyanobacteria bacterium J06649_11]
MSLLINHPPSIEIDPSKSGATISLNDVSKSIYNALTQYPYYIVVKGFTPLRERTQLMDFGRAIRAKISPRSRTNREDINKVSFTKVYINRQEEEAETGGATQYSRTHLRLPPHTDSSYMMLPHEIVAFHCIEADDSGGETIMVPIDHILKHIEEKTITLLKDPVYPFGKGCHAIICGDEDNPLIRYYHAQVKRFLTLNTPTFTKKHQKALLTLDELLEQTDIHQKFHLKPGQILFMHNHKVLHGRTALLPESNRILYR